MAYLPEDLEKKKDEEGLKGEGSSAVSVGTGAGTGTSPGVAPGDVAGATGSEPAGRRESGRRFTGIQEYIERNRPATGRIAEQVGGRVEQLGETARGTIGTQSEAFNKRVEGAEIREDQALTQSVYDDPSAISGDEARRAQFMRARDAQYGGPQALEDTDLYESISSSLGAANTAREQAGTTEGRKNLLGRTARPGSRITAGRLALDEALLASDPNAQARLTQATGSLSDLEGRLAEASQGARTRATEGAATTAATQAATRGALTGARTQFETGLEERLGGARTAAQERIDAARAALGTGGTTIGLNKGALGSTMGKRGAGASFADLTPEQIAATGLSEQQLIDILTSVKGSGGLKGKKIKGGEGEREVSRKQALVNEAFGDRGVDAFYEGDIGTQLFFRPEAQGSEQALSDLGIDPRMFEVALQGGINPLIQENRTRGLQGTQPVKLEADFARQLGDPSQYLSSLSPDAAITRENLATEGDFSRQAALNDLSGEQIQFLQSALSGQAGTAPEDLTEFDTEGFGGDVRSAYMGALEEAARIQGVNARSGGDSFLKALGRNPLGGVADFMGPDLGPLRTDAGPGVNETEENLALQRILNGTV